MFDYSEDGLRARQADLTVAYLNLIDTKLAKINRKLAIITLLALGTIIYEHKHVLKELKNVKGE